ncbi:MAG: heme-binding protein [Phycisphaeraceae bacterium]
MLKRLISLDSRRCLPALLFATTVAAAGCGDDGGSAKAPATSAGVATIVNAAAPNPPALPKLKPEPTAPDNPRAAKNIEVKDGFQVELLYEIDKPSQGSWVALCKGPNGTLFATDQYNKEGQALYQITPPAIGDYDAQTKITAHPVKLNGAQGLYYGFGALYVMESGRGNGLMRVTDSDGDGLLDKKEQILNIYGGGEHGTHAIVPTADGKAMYIVAGNMSPLPKVDKSRVPLGFGAKVDENGLQLGLWDEDQTLKREPDGRGHASRVMAPGGWICKIDPDGSNLTLISQGYRNAYDVAVMPNGELFTYDSDMEWDLGLPWYRPTRVNHAVSGSEFGWRNGSGKWPTYFEDSLASVVDIGPGSPVGVLFGTGAKFPTAYQSALFLLDWTYGTIYAVHMTPDGASYTGVTEPFLYGKPLPLTDAAIGDDGAMYFTTGGRRGDSKLYRVVYYGVNDTAAPPKQELNDAAKLRRQIETLHVQDPPADKIDFIWEMLDRDDRHIRFAARVALEHQPIERYLDRAKAEKDPMTRTAAGLALARHRHNAASEVLLGVDLAEEDDTTKLAWLRAVGVLFARSGNPGEAATKQYLDKLAGLVPSDNVYINTELVRLRVFLEDPTVIKFALDLMNKVSTPTPPWMDLAAKNDRYGAAIIKMRDNPPPSVQFGIAFMLRNIKDGWTMTDRQAYFSWLNRAEAAGGGNSYENYLKNVRNQAIATLTETEKKTLGPLLEPLPKNDNYPKLVEPKGPGRTWTTPMATKLVEARLKPGTRSYDRGAGLYQSTLCVQCHRVNDFGGQIGPDLTTAVNKFSVKDMLLHTIEPSFEVSEQYALSIVTKKDGEKVIGRVLEKTAEVVKVQPNVLAKETIDVPVGQVAKIEDAPTSAMPQGLVNPLSADELTDLIAFIMSKGDPEHEYFKKKQ